MVYCPRCHSANVRIKKNVEALATPSAALYGLKTGSEMGVLAGPIGTIIGATIGAFLGGVAGSTFGSLVDEKVIASHVCLDCGHEFNL